MIKLYNSSTAEYDHVTYIVIIHHIHIKMTMTRSHIVSGKKKSS